MAVNVYIGNGGGAGDETWTTNANWSLGVAPVANDDVVFDGQATDGNQNCTIAINPAIALDSLTVGPNYTGTIGVAAGLKLSPTSIGTLYLSHTAPFYVDTTITAAIIRDASTTVGECEIDGIYTDLVIHKGNVTIVTGATMLRLSVNFVSSRRTDAVVTIPAGCVIVGATIAGGATVNSSPIGDLRMFGGELTHAAGDITTLEQAAGTLNYEADGNTYTLGLAELWGGTFDASNDPLPKVIDTMIAWRPAIVDLANKMNNIVVNNPIVTFGVSPKVDENSTIVIA